MTMAGTNGLPAPRRLIAFGAAGMLQKLQFYWFDGGAVLAPMGWRCTAAFRLRRTDSARLQSIEPDLSEPLHFDA
jgi:hypothetical protein